MIQDLRILTQNFGGYHLESTCCLIDLIDIVVNFKVYQRLNYEETCNNLPLITYPVHANSCVTSNTIDVLTAQNRRTTTEPVKIMPVFIPPKALALKQITE